MPNARLWTLARGHLGAPLRAMLRSTARANGGAVGRALWASALCFLAAFTCLGAPPQSPESFSAVKVRPVSRGFPAEREPIHLDPAGLHAASVTLEDLILKAYGIEIYQLAGGDNWVRGQHFSVDAVTDKPATPAGEMLMLQALLASEFGLQLSHETKGIAGHELVISKGGLRSPPLGTNERLTCPQLPPGEFPILQSETASALVSSMNRRLPIRSAIGGPVLDRTGLTGRYRFCVVVTAEPIDGGVRSDLGGIPDALKAIGLELRPITVQLEIYTIERAVQPQP